MKLIPAAVAGSCLAFMVAPFSIAQTLTGSSQNLETAAKLEQLSKKIDEQNAKIDVLSQQILKLQQQVSNIRPGVMIGEGSGAGSATAAPAETPRPQAGASHIVARGETLTSIAKLYGVSVSELQKYNHIENDRKLQIGQTLLIPGGTPESSASPSGD
jgi:LysM repeat protein